MIDICDFAVGLSRQLYGLTIATERPGHRMMETWHPLGGVGVISAFNFPVVECCAGASRQHSAVRFYLLHFTGSTVVYNRLIS